MRIIVSIPVHEKPEVIKDQISNIKKYIPQVTIVLHINYNYYEKFSDSEIVGIEGVLVNSEHLPIQWGNIIDAHLSNYHFLKKIDREFDYFLMHASNDMYVKKGVEKYIYSYDAGFAKHIIYSDKTIWWPGIYAIKDPKLESMMKVCGQKQIVASQVEGSFYKKNIMDDIYNIIVSVYSIGEKSETYPKEEVYFSTIAASMVSEKNRGYPTTFSEVHQFDRIDWIIRSLSRKIFKKIKEKTSLFNKQYEWFERYFSAALLKTQFYKLKIKTVKKIIEGNLKFIQKNKYLYDGISTYQLYSDQLFSVKRVKRIYNDKVRKFIRNIDTQ